MNDHEFDRLFRERLAPHSESPPAGSWDAIRKRVKSGIPPREASRGFTLLGGVVLSILLLLLAVDDRTLVTASAEADSHPALLKKEPNLTQAGLPEAQPVTPQPPASGHPSALSADPEPVSVKMNAAPRAEPALLAEHPGMSADPGHLPAEQEAEAPRATALEFPSLRLLSVPMRKTSLYLPVTEHGKAMPATPPSTPSRPFRLHPYLALALIPELTLHPDGTRDPEMTYQGGMTAGLQYRGMLAETGVWASRNSASWDYGINYLSNDSIDWYWDVVSVSFIPLVNFQGDTIGWEPQFAAVQQALFDSVAHQEQFLLEHAYSYLHFPFSMGITRGIPGVPRFTYSLKGGIIFSKAIRTQEETPSFTANGRRITGIDDKRLLRAPNYTQLTLGIGLSYRVSQHWSLSAEPQWRYFRNPYYLKPDGTAARKPYSIGLVTGIRLMF